MVLHDVRNAVNIYGDSALINNYVDQLLTTIGSSPDAPTQYDDWDHVDYLTTLAREKGLYKALVPVWVSNVKSGSITKEKATTRQTSGIILGQQSGKFLQINSLPSTLSAGHSIIRMVSQRNMARF